MANPQLVFEIDWDGKHYTFDADKDLTVSRLRQIKSWFPDLCNLMQVVLQFRLQDADAAMCVLWVMKAKAGEMGLDARRMEDFAVGEFHNAISVLDAGRICTHCDGRGWNPPEAEEVPLGPGPTSEPRSDTSEETPTV